MDTKADAGIAAFDTLKLLVAGSILLGGIFGYYYYSDVSVLIRAIGVLLAFALGVVVALQSTRGQAFVRFVQGARAIPNLTTYSFSSGSLVYRLYPGLSAEGHIQLNGVRMWRGRGTFGICRPAHL